MKKVKTGIDNIDEYMDIFKGKRVGLITNNTGYNSEFKSTIDILNERTNLTALYSPEHGIRGDIQAGEKVESYIDLKTGIRVYSLYGKNRRPSKEILENVDVLAFDIQDVGCRFYTYLYTMSYAMESCTKFDKEFVVFDRPNPINGNDVEGNILNKNYSSFVGRYPIPQRYGLTIGEIAGLFNEEFLIGCKLKVIPIKNWNREMYYEDTGLNFIMPSPNMPTVDTAVVYPGTCIFEGTNISEGRGTTRPFEIVGAPWLDGFKIANMMNNLKLEGVKFRPVFFTPTFSKHSGKLCEGVQIHVRNRKTYKPVKTGIFLYEIIKQESKNKFNFITFEGKKLKYGIDLLVGNNILREGNASIDKIYEKWQEDSLKFKELKKKYHLY